MVDCRQGALDRWFPGFSAQLDAVGSPYVRWLDDVHLYLNNGWLKREDIGLVTRGVTRPMLEWLVRQEVGHIENIRFVQNCDVERLLIGQADRRGEGGGVGYSGGAGVWGPKREPGRFGG